MIDVNILKENVDEVNRLKEIEKQYELNGQFDHDTDENSYDNCLPVTKDYPFVHHGIKYFFKHIFVMNIIKKVTKEINTKLTNLKVVGQENLKGIKGAIVTCNHISKLDSFAVREAVGLDIKFVAADFNNWNNQLGELLRYSGYLPLSAKLDIQIMRKFDEAITYYLHKNKKILIYPEQAMWREYKQPRPLKNGAYHYAVKNNVPIIPLFITMKEKEVKIDEQNRLNPSDYIIHILPPIYPQENLSTKENIEYMKLENFRLWRECYEQTYGKKIKYTTLDWSPFEKFKI